MFRIYYADHESYSEDPFNAPGLGALLIVETDSDHGRRIVSGGDYFVWDQVRWWPVDFIGLVDYLLQPGPRKVLVGRMVSNELYREVYMRADTDPDFPIRTAYGVFENKLSAES
jgi:hypothetical protein